LHKRNSTTAIAQKKKIIGHCVNHYLATDKMTTNIIAI